MTLDLLKKDNAKHRKLIAVLRNQLLLLKENHRVDYTLLRDVMHLVQGNQSQSYLARKELVFTYYLDNIGDHGQLYFLLHQYKEILQQSDEIIHLLDMVLNDVVVPLDILIQELDNYLDRQTLCLSTEHEQVLPLLIQSFSEKDWQLIEQNSQSAENILSKNTKAHNMGQNVLSAAQAIGIV